MDDMTFFFALAGWFYVSIAIMTGIFLLTSFAKSEVVLGDFYTNGVLMKDDLKSAVSLYEDIIPSSDYVNVRKHSRWLLDRIDEYLKGEYSVRSIYNTTLEILETEISMHLAEGEPLSDTVLSYIHYFLENEDVLLRNKIDQELCRVLMFRLISYLGCSHQTLEAKDLFGRVVSSIKHKDKVMIYYIKQNKHLLHLLENFFFLKNRKNIRTSSMWLIYSLFSAYYEIEEKINGVPTDVDL